MTEAASDKNASADTTTKPDPAGKPGADGDKGTSATSKKDDLESILAEYEDKSGKSDPADKGGSGDPKDKDGQGKDDNVVALSAADQRMLKDFASQYQAQQTRTEIGNVVSEMQEKHPELKHVKPKWLEARLNLEARDKPAIARAFMNRAADPATWRRIVGAMGESLAAEMADSPDPTLTQNREAAIAAARTRNDSGANTQKVTNAELDKMSDVEFEAHKRARGRR